MIRPMNPASTRSFGYYYFGGLSPQPLLRLD